MYESYCFVDADVTFLRKDAVETLINQYQLQDEKGLLSVQPYHITTSVSTKGFQRYLI